jgi:hypothetical protein
MVRPRGRSLLLGLLLAVGLGVLIERLVVTDAEAIEALLEEFRDAAKDREWKRIRPVLSDDFAWGQRGPDETVAEVERIAQRYPPTRIEVEWGAIAPARLRCEVDVTYRAWGYGGVWVGQVRVTFAREKDGWRLLEAQPTG